jgi:hypothetical protein
VKGERRGGTTAAYLLAAPEAEGQQEGLRDAARGLPAAAALLQSLPAASGSWHAGGQLQSASECTTPQKDRQADRLAHKCCATPTQALSFPVPQATLYLNYATPCVNRAGRNAGQRAQRVSWSWPHQQPTMPLALRHASSNRIHVLTHSLSCRCPIKPSNHFQTLHKRLQNLQTPLHIKSLTHLAAAAPQCPALQTPPPKVNPAHPSYRI